ncbi:MAG: toxin [Verrucomicrobiota bacterium]
MNLAGKAFDWSETKNEILIAHRGISFDEVAQLLSTGNYWQSIPHPNPEKYPDQKLFLIPIDNYIFVVPYLIDGDRIYLKTIFPSRKLTATYLKWRQSNG